MKYNRTKEEIKAAFRTMENASEIIKCVIALLDMSRDLLGQYEHPILLGRVNLLNDVKKGIENDVSRGIHLLDDAKTTDKRVKPLCENCRKRDVLKGKNLCGWCENLLNK